MKRSLLVALSLLALVEFSRGQTLAIGSLNAGANNVASSPLSASSTGKAVFGFSFTSSGTQTVTAINVQLSSTPVGKLSNWSLVKSTDANFATGGDNTTVGALTFTPSATQVAIVGLSEVITAGSNYFLLADVDAAVTGATPAVQASLAPPNVTVSAGTVVSSATGTNYTFQALTLTIGSLNAGANNVALSPLAAGTTGKAVFGFSLTSNGSQTVTAISVQLTSDPSGKLSNWSLVKSTDANFATGGDNSTVGGGITFTPSATQVVIAGLAQVITSGSNYFLRADVNSAVTNVTTSIQASLVAANVTASAGSVSGTATGINYSFSNSQLSDITLNGGTTTPSIAYGSFQTASGLTAGNAVSLGQFQISDGGGSDPDNKSTTLTDVTIGLANFANVRTIAIFDGGTNIGEQAAPGSTVTFSGLSLVASDDGTKNFRIRATFNAVVFDNQPITITINSATALITGSGFATGNAGGATTGGGTNLIDVVADHLIFGAAPVGVSPGVNFSLTVSAVDNLDNTDINRTNTVTLSKTSGTGTLSSSDAGGLTPNLVAGTRSWSQVKISSPGGIGAKQLTASYAGLTSATVNFSVASLGVTIIPATPTTLCFGGDFVTLTNITLTESDDTDFSPGTNQTFYLQLPAGFIFDTSVTTAPTVGGGNISNPSALSYVGNTFVRFSYDISGTSSTDHFIITGLKVRYPGTIPVASQPIVVLDASAIIAGDAESNGRSHGLLTASASPPALFGFTVATLPAGTPVNPNDTRFSVSNQGVQLNGTPSGGSFSGNGVSLSATNGYTFSPAAVGVGTGYIVTYTYSDPSAPHCTSVFTKTFEVFTSNIQNLLTDNCENGPPSLNLMVDPNYIHTQYGASYNLTRFVYFDVSSVTTCFQTFCIPFFGCFSIPYTCLTYNTPSLPGPNPAGAKFDPIDPAYQNSYYYENLVNGQRGVYVGFEISDGLFSTFIPERIFVKVKALPNVSFNTSTFATAFCANGPAVDLFGSPTPTSTITDDFFTHTGPASASVANAGGNSWKLTPANATVTTTAKSVNVSYTYKDLSTGCSNTTPVTIMTIYPVPAAVPPGDVSHFTNISGPGTGPAAGGNITICYGDPVPTFAAAPSGGPPVPSYNWYTNGLTLLSFGRPQFTPSSADFDNKTPGTTNFKVTQSLNGCEGPFTTISITVNPPVIVTAGTAGPICAGGDVDLTSFGASITGAVTTGTWSGVGGALSFWNGAKSSNTSVFGTAVYYTPDPSEVSAGFATITLTSADPAGPCPSVQSFVTVVINQGVTINAFAKPFVCPNQPNQSVDLSGSISGGGATAGIWDVITGLGGFGAGSVSSLTITLGTDPTVSTFYNPTPAEKTASIVKVISLRLRSDDPPGPCTPASQTINVTLNPAPIVTVAPDFQICADLPVPLNGSFSGGANFADWATSGGGTITAYTNTNSPVNTAYTFSSAELNSTTPSTITFALTSDDPDGGGPCFADTKKVNVTVNPIPLTPTLFPVSFPTNVQTAYCVNDVLADLVAQGAGTIKWYANNAGTLGTLLVTNSNLTPTVSNTVPSTTIYFATQTVNGCESRGQLPSGAADPAADTLIINPRPVLSFTVDSLCTTNASKFIASFTPFAGSVLGYQWDFADGTTLTGSTTIGSFTVPYSPSNDQVSHDFTTGSWDVTLGAISDQGCTNSVKASALTSVNSHLPANSPVRIGPYPKPDFDVANLCDGDVPQFTGHDNSANNPATNTWLWDFGEPSSGSNTSGLKDPTHTYGGVSIYPVSFKIVSTLGCPANITKLVPILPYIKTFPFTEDFEGGIYGNTGGWATEGFNPNVPKAFPVTSSTSWQLDSPNERIITSASSGSNAWITNGYTGPGGFKTYRDNERSVLNGPCFDMTKLSRPVVSLKYWSNTENGQDGTYVEIDTTDGQNWRRLGQVNTGLGWYNRISILGLSPASGIGQTLGQEGWTGLTSGWTDGKFNMDAFKKNDKLRIRIVFGSSADNKPLDTLDGFAIDDFAMENRNRTLLAENFTNSTADVGNSNSNNFYSFQSSATTNELVKIEYHTGIGGADALYQANKSDPDARAGFYGVTSSFQGFVSGSSGGAFPASPGGWSKAAYDLQSLITSPLDISISTPATPNDSLFHVQVTDSTKQDMPPGQYVIQIGVIEKVVGSNKFVLRKLLPDAAGTPLTALTKNSVQTTPVYSWNMVNITNPSSMAVVAFVQSLLNVDDKTVVQAKYLDTPTLPITVTGAENLFSSDLIEVFPNPSNKEFNIQLPTIARRQVGLKLWDQMGKLVHESFIPEGAFTKTVGTSELAGGVYILHVDSGNGITARKKVMVVHTQ